MIFQARVKLGAQWGERLRLSLLGGSAKMSQPTIYAQAEKAEEGKEQLLQLLNEALGLADALALPPEIGARIQEVIDLADGHCHSVDPSFRK